MKQRKKLSRNAACACGSGKKYKHCCLGKDLDFLVDHEGQVLRRIRIGDDLTEALEDARDHFISVFGREPGRGDPVLLSRYLGSEQDLEDRTAELLEGADIPPEYVYAYRKTGLLVTEDNKSKHRDPALAEWDEAIQEFHVLSESGEIHEPTKLEQCISRVKWDLHRSRIMFGMFLDKCGVSGFNFFHDFALFCVAKCAKTLSAISALLDQHFGEDALAGSRPIYETYLQLLYLQRNPSKTEDLFASTVGIARGTHEYAKTKKGKIDRRVVIERQTGREFEGFVSTRIMAESSPFDEDQWLQQELYEFLSRFTHPNVLSIASYVEGDRFDSTKREMVAEATMLALFVSTLVLEQIPTLFFLPEVVAGDLERFVRSAKEIVRETVNFLETQSIRDALTDAISARTLRLGEYAHALSP